MNRKEAGIYADTGARVTLYGLTASTIALVALIDHASASFVCVRLVYLFGVLFITFSGIEIWATRHMTVIWGKMSPGLAEKYGIAVAILGGLGALLFLVNALFLGL